MSTEEIQNALNWVRQATDLNTKALLLSGLVSELFRRQGFEPVVVGGSAIEFYTDGAYMSGDTDICWTGIRTPKREQCAAIMAQIPGAKPHGGKSWQIENLWIDLLGEINYLAEKELAKIQTPVGFVVLIPIEDLLVGRVYAARKWTGYNEEDDDCAKKLMTSVLSQSVAFDWDEALKIANSPNIAAKRSCLRFARRSNKNWRNRKTNLIFQQP